MRQSHNGNSMKEKYFYINNERTSQAHNCLYGLKTKASYRRQMSSHPPPTSAFADFMENSIPQTTTLFNRMYKKSTSAGGAGTVVGVSGTVAPPKITGTSGWRPETGKRKVRSDTLFLFAIYSLQTRLAFDMYVDALFYLYLLAISGNSSCNISCRYYSKFHFPREKRPLACPDLLVNPVGQIQYWSVIARS